MYTPDQRQQIRNAIIDMTRHQRVNDRLRPEEVIRAVGASLQYCGGPELPEAIREEAATLAQQGRIALYRKSSVADPGNITGAYTIGNPWSGNTDDRDYNIS